MSTKRKTPSKRSIGVFKTLVVRSYDDALTGKRARFERVAVGLSLRSVATLMGFSAAYVCDLELGRRKWSDKLVVVYTEALK